MASLASKVNVKPVNRRALRRYGEFWRALQMVGAAIAEAEKVAAKADPGKRRGAAGALVHPHPGRDEGRRQESRASAGNHVEIRETVGSRTDLPRMEAALMSRTVDRCVEDLDKAMRELRRTLRGIPFRAGGFKNTHDNLARDVAHLTVLLDSARGAFNK